MRLVTLSILILFLHYNFLASQSAPVTIDGRFEDWPPELSGYTDPVESIGEVDLLEFQVTNDEQFLFLKIVLDTELNLKEDDPVAHNIYLYIDTDNNAETGFNVQDGFGAELGINFSNLSANFDVNSTVTIGLSKIQLRMEPTVTSTQFEIAIGRDAVPDNVHDLFTSPTIKILFKNWDNGDIMPNEGEVFSYTFDETPVSPLVPAELEKNNPDFIRIVAYNTRFDGLSEPGRVGYFEKVIKALNPDIIGYSECYDTPASTVTTQLNSWLPLGTTNGWHVVKKGDLITASRWPVLRTWPSITRQFPVLIDLPESYPRDLLFTNAHLKCCGGNSERQSQVDEYVNFMLQLKAGGAVVGFTENTPFVYAGDLNLVGYGQQLTTLLTGDIQNINNFGQGAPLDWDDSDLTDQICVHTDKRMAYTWRNDNSSYPPGRLDFIIFSDAVMTAEKAYSLQTEIMPAERLLQYGLNNNDTGNASDHFPLVTDFTIDVVDNIAETKPVKYNIFPNPVNKEITIHPGFKTSGNVYLNDALGKVVLSIKGVSGSQTIDVSQLPSGIYFVIIEENDGDVFKYKIVKK